jgi:hypothetical protein
LLKTVPLAGESCTGVDNVQFQVTLALLVGPLKVKVSLQSLSGIAMLTCVVFPGESVPPAWVKVTPVEAEDADHCRLPLAFWASESVSVHVQPWLVNAHWLGLKLLEATSGPEGGVGVGDGVTGTGVGVDMTSVGVGKDVDAGNDARVAFAVDAGFGRDVRVAAGKAPVEVKPWAFGLFDVPEPVKRGSEAIIAIITTQMAMTIGHFDARRRERG